MDFEQYMINEAKRAKPINENMSKVGETEVWKGDDFCGAHYHRYVIWAAAKGDGWTGVAVPTDTETKSIAGHQHMIVDGKCLEAQGHTHEIKSGKIVNSINVGDETATVPVTVVKTEK